MPASTMKTTTTHWLAAAKGSSERGSGEKPPVGRVVNACATALKRFIRSSTPVSPNTVRMSASAAVSAT